MTVSGPQRFTLHFFRQWVRDGSHKKKKRCPLSRAKVGQNDRNGRGSNEPQFSIEKLITAISTLRSALRVNLVEIQRFAEIYTKFELFKDWHKRHLWA